MSDFLRGYSARGETKLSSHTKTDACLVLKYQRVALLSYDPLQTAVEPCNFDRQMEYLAENFNIVSINEIKQHLETATAFKEKTAAITFDSSYADLLYTVKDILERYEIPAAVFVPSANIIEQGQFWWDVLENLILASRFQGELKTEIDSQLYRWPLATSQDRFQAYEDLYEILSEKSPLEQKAIIERIAMDWNFQAKEPDSHGTMNAQEIKRLEQGGLITIGGHTHNCVKPSPLPRWQLAEEISRNKDILEEILGHNVEYFSYPYGNGNGCTAEAAGILQNIGFSLAFGDSYGTVDAADQPDCYDLPRVRVGNWKPFAFYKFLKRFFD